ncbi:hypothetical protein [Mycolicibacterium sphagni]|uniref:Uncharacterized protein n=1 Tax=Mycolicibacterium sphagni TaxID=1786 RepID=A0ABX2JLV3_9MYCO|nr:hypothetical protein [Mycolicibacterium sphagni]NTY58671.1 hypothetical protein [Mycolicibacterium sphagni]
MKELEVGTVHKWLATNGDAAVWVCPRRDSTGYAATLRFTSATGVGYAVTLTAADLERITATAAAIMAASPDTIEDWIDQAAEAVQGARNALQPNSTITAGQRAYFFETKDQVTPPVLLSRCVRAETTPIQGYGVR